jgi:hypothetical protein
VLSLIVSALVAAVFFLLGKIVSPIQSSIFSISSNRRYWPQPHLYQHRTDDGKQHRSSKGRPWMWASGHNGRMRRAAHGYEALRL